MSEQNNKVWATFVGAKGDQLKAFNSQDSYPPKEKTDGYVAIGWSAMGDMALYEESGHADYLARFKKIYSEPTMSANALWNFAFSMKKGDWVISPSAATGYVLIGEIVSDYIADFDNQFGFHRLCDAGYFHLRMVKWLYVIPKNDERYTMVNKVGMLTVSESRFSIDELKSMLDTNVRPTWSNALIEQTRELFDGSFVPNDELISMKNIDGSFGSIHIDDFLAKPARLRIKDGATGSQSAYVDVDALIMAGWAMD